MTILEYLVVLSAKIHSYNKSIGSNYGHGKKKSRFPKESGGFPENDKGERLS